MRLMCLLLVGIVCLIPGDICAQGIKKLKPLVSATMPEYLRSGGAQVPSFALGNMRLKIPPTLMNSHGLDLQISHFDMQLSPSVYTRSAAKNNAQIFKSLQRFMKDYDTFHSNAAKIVSNIEGRVIKGKIPYASYLPKDLQTLYVGEVHNIAGLAQEVESLIRQLPKIYPGRHIYLATEFLPAYEQIPVGEERAVTSRREVDTLLDGCPRRTTSVILTALEENIPVIGLEPEYAILQKLIRETGNYPTLEMFEEFVTSFEGVRFRNQIWSKYLRALRQADPEALIVVYAGYGHVAYHRDFNLPSMLGGRSFVMLFTTPEFLPLNNPFFRYLREDASIRAQFHSSPNAKLVERWKKTTFYKKIIGTDMAVILHPQPEN